MNRITDEQFTLYKNTFKLFDTNNNNYITQQEFADALFYLGQKVSDSDFDELINTVDVNANGRIEFDEFCTLLMQLEAEKEEDMRESFQYFDKDSDGFITAFELRTVIMSLGGKISEEESESIVREADTDGDNQLNFEEFVAMVEKP